MSEFMIGDEKQWDGGAFNRREKAFWQFHVADEAERTTKATMVFLYCGPEKYPEGGWSGAESLHGDAADFFLERVEQLKDFHGRIALEHFIEGVWFGCMIMTRAISGAFQGR